MIGIFMFIKIFSSGNIHSLNSVSSSIFVVSEYLVSVSSVSD